MANISGPLPARPPSAGTPTTAAQGTAPSTATAAAPQASPPPAAPAPAQVPAPPRRTITAEMRAGAEQRHVHDQGALALRQRVSTGLGGGISDEVRAGGARLAPAQDPATRGKEVVKHLKAFVTDLDRLYQSRNGNLPAVNDDAWGESFQNDGMRNGKARCAAAAFLFAAGQVHGAGALVRVGVQLKRELLEVSADRLKRFGYTPADARKMHADLDGINQRLLTGKCSAKDLQRMQEIMFVINGETVEGKPGTRNTTVADLARRYGLGGRGMVEAPPAGATGAATMERQKETVSELRPGQAMVVNVSDRSGYAHFVTVRRDASGAYQVYDSNGMGPRGDRTALANQSPGMTLAQVLKGIGDTYKSQPRQVLIMP